MRDSPGQDAARPGQRRAQVPGALIPDPVRRQVQDLQGCVVPHHLRQVAHAVAAHTVTARDRIKAKKKNRLNCSARVYVCISCA